MQFPLDTNKEPLSNFDLLGELAFLLHSMFFMILINNYLWIEFESKVGHTFFRGF